MITLPKQTILKGGFHMKKLIAVTIIAVIGLSVLAFVQQRAKSSDHADKAMEETILQDGDYMPFQYEVEAAEMLPSFTMKVPTGDMTIRNARRVNLSNATGLGPLVGGKLVYFRQVGNPIRFTDKNNEQQSYYNTEIRIADCTYGSDYVIYTISPVGEILCAAGLDGTNAYVMFSSANTSESGAASDDIRINAELADDEKRLEVSPDYRSIILQINVENGMTKEFTPALGNAEISEIIPLGSENLLIHSYRYENYSEEVGASEAYERMDVLNLSDGSLRNFYTGGELSSTAGNSVEISFVSASEDKVYFSTKTSHDGMVDYGFRVYTSDMNFVYGEDVTALKKNEAASASAEMGVSNGNIFYKLNRDVDDGTQSYYKYSPTTMGYTQVPFENDSGNYEYNQMALYSANPRNSTEFDYSILQGIDENGISHVYLSNSVQNTFYQLEIDIPGFKYPKFKNHYYPVVTDYSGDFLLLSAGSDYYDNSGFKKPFEYFYIPAEEMRRAMYNETSDEAAPSDTEPAESAIELQ